MHDDTHNGQSIRQSPRESTAPSPRTADSAIVPPLLTEKTFRDSLGGMSERKFKALRAAGFIPDPLMLGERCPRWTQEDRAETLRRLPRRPLAPEPATLAEGRRQRIEAVKGAR